MTRIFFTIAAFSLILLIGALMLGLTMGDLYAKPAASNETLHWATLHRLTGVAAALAVVFVECVVVTYFIGTSRWCKEVVETYQFDRAIIVESNRLKRGTFPWALGGMLAVVGIISLGGAADPASTIRHNWQAWALPHLLGALVGIVFIAWTYFVAWNNIIANHAIIERLVADVGRIRRAQGLDVSETNADIHTRAGPIQPSLAGKNLDVGKN